MFKYAKYNEKYNIQNTILICSYSFYNYSHAYLLTFVLFKYTFLND